MNTYLYTWNPKKWTWSDLQEAIYKVNNNKDYSPYWSCGNTKKINIGDMFFIIKLGVAPKGIIGGGYITSKPYDLPHWDLNKAKESLKNFFNKIVGIIKNKEDISEQSLRDEFDNNFVELENQQEKYASRFGKYDLVKQEAIKRKERLDNIDKEIKNWRDLKNNSSNKLEELKEKINYLESNLDKEEDKPRQIAEKRGSYQQNIKNTEEDIENIKSSLVVKENKINEGEQKYILKKSLQKHLPKKLIYRIEIPLQCIHFPTS